MMMIIITCGVVGTAEWQTHFLASCSFVSCEYVHWWWSPYVAAVDSSV